LSNDYTSPNTDPKQASRVTTLHLTLNYRHNAFEFGRCCCDYYTEPFGVQAFSFETGHFFYMARLAGVCTGHK